MISKKFLAWIIIAAMILPYNAFAVNNENENNSFDYASAYKWAQDVGFSSEFLKDISEESLKQVYYDNVDAEEIVIQEEVDLVSTEDLVNGDGESFFSIAPYSSAIETRGAINTSHMQLRKSYVQHVNSSTKKITDVVVYFTAEWLNGRPYVREVDAITANWDHSVFSYASGSFWGRLESKSNGSGTVITANSSTTLSKSSQGGLGWYSDLGLSPLGYVPIVRIGFKLLPKSTMYSTEKTGGSIKTTNINGEYAHDVGLTSSVTLGVSGFSVTISGHVDSMAQAITFRYK